VAWHGVAWRGVARREAFYEMGAQVAHAVDARW
jgi:hypothetical protein